MAGLLLDSVLGRDFFLHKHAEWFWDPPSLLFNGLQGLSLSAVLSSI